MKNVILSRIGLLVCGTLLMGLAGGCKGAGSSDGQMSKEDQARFNQGPTPDQRAQMAKIRQENESKSQAAAGAYIAAQQQKSATQAH